MKKANIYILVHESRKMFKIWKTTSFKERLFSLKRTWGNFLLDESFIISCNIDDMSILEHSIHLLLKDYRIQLDATYWNWYTEFFHINWLKCTVDLINSFQNQDIMVSEWINIEKYVNNIKKSSFSLCWENDLNKRRTSIIEKEDFIVKKHINMLYLKSTVSSNEMKIMWIIMGKFNNLWYWKELVLSIEELFNLMQFKSKWSLSDLRKYFYLSLNLKVDIEFVEGWVIIFHYIQSAPNVFKLTLNSKIKTLLFSSHNIIIYNIKNILNINNVHVIRMYELLLFHKTNNRVTFKIEELRKYLHLVWKYTLFANFKIKILDVLIREINNNTDLKIDYKSMKEWRKVIWIDFEIN